MISLCMTASNYHHSILQVVRRFVYLSRRDNLKGTFMIMISLQPLKKVVLGYSRPILDIISPNLHQPFLSYY